jgi:hypothetical protein
MDMALDMQKVDELVQEGFLEMTKLSDLGADDVVVRCTDKGLDVMDAIIPQIVR